MKTQKELQKEVDKARKAFEQALPEHREALRANYVAALEELRRLLAANIPKPGEK
jgi:hypothetical protein